MRETIVKSLLLAGLAALLAFSTSTPSRAISAELAKKCRLMAIKAHPTEPPGSKSKFEEEQRAYFDECIAKNGKM